MSDVQPNPTWWQASDGRWYPPETHPAYRPMPVRTHSDAMGTASVILAILWLGGIGSLLAVIFAGAQLGRNRDDGHGDNGPATAGLVLGILGMAITAWLIATSNDLFRP
jgi:hypothetical protein